MDSKIQCKCGAQEAGRSSLHEVLACDGNCEHIHGEHAGRVRPVTVTYRGLNPMNFNYCDNAVADDESRGIDVLEHYNAEVSRPRRRIIWTI